MKWIFPILILLFTVGCANKKVEELAIETMGNARLSITAAEKAGARDVADADINSAEDMLVNSENALHFGNVERAYRLGLRAYLHARIATEKSLAVRLESQLQETQAELQLREKATEEAKNRIERLKTGRTTPEN